MKLVEDNAGMFPGEGCFVPVCSVCGCRELYKTEPGRMYRLKICPKCGHKLNWKVVDKVGR